ncbi:MULTISPECIES: type II toxin-antitoxin system TacA family antitoxin [Nostocales]|uniref:DUF1778 domain-containing protein n=3 Tax=Nostocales TaxID=1161 RepID=A0A0C1QYQ0_9CYAN|nr:DUF1778 domain-containing protein [Tolypothrix bouteillei]KAF3885561.1 DUF1778 domain-containing protein [Tolypothrix bouteillei VB521301]
MQSFSESKSERIDIRTSPAVKKLLQQSATASHKNVSEFLLEHGLIAASETLANRHLFVLNDEQWQAFQAALERPPQDKPRLRRLLTEPSVFDENL